MILLAVRLVRFLIQEYPFVQMRSQFEKLLTNTLLISCRAYLQHGATHLFAKQQTEIDLLQAILNIQASMEVVAKLHHVNADGWKAIVRDKFHNESEATLLDKLNKGELQTKFYEQSKLYLISRKELPIDAAELLGKLQGYRNSIANLGLPSLSSDIKGEIITLMVRVLNTLVWEALTKDSYLSNRASSIFGTELFGRIIADPTYISEAIDLAHEISAKVRNCPECGHKAWAQTEYGELDIVCLCCGFAMTSDMVGFADCPVCGSEGDLYYDAINTPDNNVVAAKCLHCDQKLSVILCSHCGHVSQARPKWVCPKCPS